MRGPDVTLTRFILLAILLACSATARAQTSGLPYEAPDAGLWAEMKTALGNINATLSAHQQIQQILQSVEREAQIRAARKASDAKQIKPEPKKD